MTATYYINLNYICNERCIFCAADVPNNLQRSSRRTGVTLEEVKVWVGDEPPTSGDRVMLAGGEPTLHKELLPIVRFLSTDCRDLVLFTNGLRLVDPEFARDVVEAGVTRFEIALFGATEASHEAITQVPGSFERTLAALNTLAALRHQYDFTIEVRLLVSRQSSPENPTIVRLIRERAPGIDAVSLNRLILSESAKESNATISWEEARASINESAQLVRKFGYDLVFGAIPLCIFDGDNAAHVRKETTMWKKRTQGSPKPTAWQVRYLDPTNRKGRAVENTTMARVALPDPCLQCDYLSVCGRVEGWYIKRYGTTGLRTIQFAQ